MHPPAQHLGLDLALSLLLATSAQAASREGSDPVQVIALAVAEDSSGTFAGVHAIVEAQALAGGSGQVFVATKPLAQTDMQGSARLASRVAAATLGADWSQYDYLVSFRSDSTVIGGPSAGAVMALALTTALHNLLEPNDSWALDPGVAATGTINPDGTVGPVGGIPAKAEGAKAAGITHFLYPAGLEVATTQVRGRITAVDMSEHCADLEIRCSPAASLVDILRAAGIDVRETATPVPDTTDYREALAPDVQAQVSGLSDRIDAVASDSRLSRLTAVERNEVTKEVSVAQERLESARDALAEEHFYLAATRSFQGHIQTGRAENLTSFYDATSQAAQRQLVQGALDGCSEAVDAAARLTDPLRASGINALYAVGSAQQRTAQAGALRDQAAALLENAVRLDDWVESLFVSTFCVERAGTALWWADLRTTFGVGPPLGDRAALVDDALEAAREQVSYAVAVVGSAAVAEAAGRLQEAEGQAFVGRTDAAILAAIEAQTSASVAMQTAGGTAVPQAVLDAAVQAASQAIATARSQGVEPMLSVSLVELSQDQNETAQALANLWSARSLALLERPPAPAEFGGDNGDFTDPAIETTAPSLLVISAVLGGGLVAAIFTVVLLVRRPRRY
ncbi:MAG: S16 family serine protease [Thermoplasmatota archaeon]